MFRQHPVLEHNQRSNYDWAAVRDMAEINSETQGTTIQSLKDKTGWRLETWTEEACESQDIKTLLEAERPDTHTHSFFTH